MRRDDGDASRLTGKGLLRTLNNTSIKPVGYGERFVKRRGLFCISSDDTMSFLVA
jgi:hypothetical protein